MKINAKKITVLAIAFFAVFSFSLILSFTIFSPKQFQVNFLTTTIELTGAETQIAESAQIGGSVFFFNRKDAKNKMEAAFPYLKVVGFEVVFPSTVVIHCGEREGLFAVKLNQFFHAIVDEEMKVLQRSDSYSSTTSNEILLNITIINTNAKVGDFLDAGNSLEKQMVKSFKNAIMRNNRGILEAKASFKSLGFQNEVIEGTQINSLQLLIQDHLGFETTLYNIEKSYAEKFECYFTAKSQLTPQDLISKSMVVIDTSDRGIVAVLID